MFLAVKPQIAVSQVLCLAQALVDVIFKVSDEELISFALSKGAYQSIDLPTLTSRMALLSGRTREIIPGGSTANSLDLLSAEGHKAVLVTGVGEDRHGSIFCEAYRNRGISLINASHPGLATGTSLVLITPDGERTMSTHLGASEALRPDALETLDIFPNTVVLIEGYTLKSGFGPDTFNVIGFLIERIKEQSGLVVLALPPVPVIRSLGEELKNSLDCYDFVHGNREEFFELFGVASTVDLRDAISDRNISTVITDGSRGASAIVSGNLWQVPAEPVEVVDLTGAGDAFLAGWVSAAIGGASVDESLKQGSRYAAKIIAQVGARLKQG